MQLSKKFGRISTSYKGGMKRKKKGEKKKKVYKVMVFQMSWSLLHAGKADHDLTIYDTAKEKGATNSFFKKLLLKCALCNSEN